MLSENKYIKNEFGFYEIDPKPSKKELASYYAKKYFQGNKGLYSANYTQDEIDYFLNKIEQKYFLIKKKLKPNNKHSLLDIGCGEGFALKFFDEIGWNVAGIDFNSYGIKNHNPKYFEKVIIGDIYNVLRKIKHDKKKFDLIWLGNILEHVLNPLELLKISYELGKKESYLIVEVPNDFSIMQKKALEMKLIDKDFWLVFPDHISYFNKEGLLNVSRKAGWKNETVIGSFPIDFNLFNPSANYIIDKKKGNGAHLQRIRLDNLMHQISIEKTNKFYEALADLGLGRQIIAIFKKQ